MVKDSCVGFCFCVRDEYVSPKSVVPWCFLVAPFSVFLSIYFSREDTHCSLHFSALYTQS